MNNLLRLLLFLSLLPAVAAARAETDPSPSLLGVGEITVTEQDVRQELLLLTPEQRTQLLAQPDSLKDWLRRIYQDKNMAAAAERLGLHQTPVFEARRVSMQRRLLAEALHDHAREQMGQPDFAALAREQYAVRRDEFELPDLFQAAHIMKRVQCACEREEQQRLAEHLLTRLEAGEDFATLARAESEDARSAARGGNLEEWLSAEKLGEPFTNALRELENGQISSVVETEHGFHIIKRLDFQPARLSTFAEVQQPLEQHLRERYVRDRLLEQALEYLPPQDAEFNEEALQALLGRAPEPSNPAPSP